MFALLYKIFLLAYSLHKNIAPHKMFTIHINGIIGS